MSAVPGPAPGPAPVPAPGTGVLALTDSELARLEPPATTRRNADRLMADAVQRVQRTKPGVALAEWWEDASPATDLACTVLKGAAAYGASVAASAIGAAVCLTGAAVSFGIAPVLGIAVGLVVSRGIAEVRYQRASDRVRSRIGGGITIEDDLGDAIAKVQRKRERVLTRAEQLTGDHTIWNTVRHAKTAFRAWRRQDDARLGAAAMGREAQATDLEVLGRFRGDGELVRRLLEFRYYGQSTFLVLRRKLREVLDSRTALLQRMSRLHGHIVRQVHFAGSHSRCGSTCYAIDLRTFQRQLAILRPYVAHGNAITKRIRQWREEPARARARRQSLVARHNVQAAGTAIGDAERLAQRARPGARLPAQQDTAPRQGRDSLPWEPGITAATAWGNEPLTGVTTGWDEWRSGLSKTSKIDHGGAGAGAGLGAAVDVLVDFVRTRYERHTARKTVLGSQRRLLDAVDSAQDEAMSDVFDLLRDRDDRKVATRAVEKIGHYLTKISGLQSQLLPSGAEWWDHFQRRVDLDLDQRIFANCKEARTAWYDGAYLLRQYEKLVAYLVFLESILLQMDRQLADFGLITRGQTITETDDAPPHRPSSLKAHVELHGFKEHAVAGLRWMTGFQR